MIVTQAFRYELDPTPAEAAGLARHAGAARFAHNWAVERCQAALAAVQPLPTAAALHRDWNDWKRTNATWWCKVSKCAPQEAFRDTQRAYRNWREGRAKPPRFHRKGIRDSFRQTGSIRVLADRIVLPRIGPVRTKESTGKFQGRILSATVRREAERWFVSLTVERDRPDPVPVVGTPVGIDLGLTAFAVLSDGECLASPRSYVRALQKLRRRSRQHARKQLGSKNRAKSAMGLARLHYRIRCRRRDFLHKATTNLVRTKPVVVVEDLAVRNLVRNRRMSRAISDAGWSEFRRMLEYKTAWYGSHLVVAPRSFPSSKRCSACGKIKERLSLEERVYRCEYCGVEIDRDLNAARNLVSLVAGSSPETANACRGTVRPDRKVGHVAVKQEAERSSTFA